jgi:hypothetical protein
MQKTFLRILAIGQLMSLAMFAQSSSGQSASGQSALDPASVGQASSGQVSGVPGPRPRAAAAPSLGEVARQLREKQSAEESNVAHPKVITNLDLGEGPEGRPDLRQAPRAASFERGSYGQQPEQQRMGDQRAGEWRGRILEQKSRVASLQGRIDQINAQMHSGAQFEGPGNRYQARQLEHLAQMQMQLDEQRRRLEEMQETARRAGMHTTVYDP